MAIRKPESKYKLILAALDDAVDLEKSDIDKYNETLDERNLVFIDGKQPSRITLRVLTRRQSKRIAAEYPLRTDPKVIDRIRTSYKAGEPVDVSYQDMDPADISWADDVAYATAVACIESVDGFDSAEAFIEYCGEDAIISLGEWIMVRSQLSKGELGN